MSTHAIIAGRFERGALIDTGGMGEVYRGRDTLTDRAVAIKALKPEIVVAMPGAVERFAREGEILRQLNHPNIVQVLATPVDQGRHYIVMEYVGGGSLAELIRTHSPLPVRRVLEIALDLADALARVHRHNIIHRDIKPANVLVAEDGTPRLTDFGVAHLDDRTRITTAGSLLGTFAYLSPEACRGEPLDARSDIWSFGVLLYELLVGRPPFDANSPVAMLNAILHAPVPNLTLVRPDVPAPLVDLLTRMLVKESTERLASARQVGATVERLLRDVLALPDVIVRVDNDDETTGVAQGGAYEITGVSRSTGGAFGAGTLSDATLPGHRPPPALPTGTITFLFTDIEGSTRLWEQYPDVTRQALVLHDALIENCVTHNNGVVVRPRGEGDSRFAVFAQASDALAAACAIQRALHDEVWSTPTPLRVRMALHTGEADLREGDYYGSAVNRCARLRAIGHGGQTLLSLATEQLARADLPTGVQLKDLGEHRLKDLSRPERVFQLVIPGLPADFPPLHSLDRRQHNLPVQTTPLIGRDHELVVAQAIFERRDVRLLTLTGPGGVGKTRLALQLAAELLDEFADGVYVVMLAAISDPALVVPTIAQILGLTDDGDQPLINRLKSFLRDQQLLLVLDNFEQVVSAAPVVADLLATAPGVKLLVTSQIVLRLSSEHEFPVPPLTLPDMDAFPAVGAGVVNPAMIDTNLLPVLEQSAAVALFVQRAQATQPSFALTSANARAVAEICTRLDGLPLAIELAAARIKLLPPATLLARLDQRLKILTGGARDRPLRQQTLRAAIEWSHRLLDVGEQQLFAWLGVFVGGCSLEAAEMVCEESRKQKAEGSTSLSSLPSAFRLLPSVFDILASLVDKSLLRQIETSDGEPRFMMLETIGEYALEQLVASGEEQALRASHCAYYLQLAEIAEPELRGAEQDVWLDRLEREHDNLRAALTWALKENRIELALRLGGALWRFWYVRGHLSEGRAWLEAALANTADTIPLLLPRAKTLIGAGALARGQGSYEQAQTLYEQGLALYRTSDDKAGIAFALNSVGVVAGEQGNYERAKALHAESLALCRELGDKPGIAWALESLGAVAGEQGDEADAMAFFTESLALRRELGHQQGIANALLNLGFMALIQHDNPRAAALLEESLGIYRELEDKQGIAIALLNLGVAWLAQDRVDTAAKLLGESLSLCQKLGDSRSIAECMEGLAGVAEARGQPGRAARLWGAAEALRESIGVPLPPSDRPRYDTNVAITRVQHDQKNWLAAWAEGRAMALEQAIAYALE